MKILEGLRVLVGLGLSILLHIGLFELARLLSNASFIPSTDTHLVFWLSFVMIEFTLGISFTGIIWFLLYVNTMFDGIE